jgi:uncharacterized membrane protein
VSLLLGGVVFLPIALLALIVVLVLARREPDPTGRGTYATYVFLVTFIALFVAVFAASTAVNAAARLVGDQSAPSPFGAVGGTPIASPLYPHFNAHAETWRTLFQALTVTVAAGLVLIFHARRARELLADTGGRIDATWRAYRYYLLATCFVAILTLLFAGAGTVYALIRTVAPGLTATGASGPERTDAIRELVGSVFVGALAWAIFLFHWRRTPTLRGRPAES